MSRVSCTFGRIISCPIFRSPAVGSEIPPCFKALQAMLASDLRTPLTSLLLFVLGRVFQRLAAGRLHPCQGSAHPLHCLLSSVLGNSNPGIRMSGHNADTNLNFKEVKLPYFLMASFSHLCLWNAPWKDIKKPHKIVFYINSLDRSARSLK